jgi:hypothetical protein
MNELIALMDKLDKKLNTSMMSQVKISMGLKSNSWKMLPKLIVDDKTD